MFDALFSPLGSEYCNFFLYVSIFSFIILVLSVVYVTYSLIYTKKSINFAQIMVLFVSTSSFVFC